MFEITKNYTSPFFPNGNGKTDQVSDLEIYFNTFKKHIIGEHQTMTSPFSTELPVMYFDWTASGRAYQPIEEKMQRDVLPLIANTHTETNLTGQSMTLAYQKAKEIIKGHVNAGANDVLLFAGSGMTGAVNKLQRLMGLRGANGPSTKVLVSHMEHHSNQLSWLACQAEVEVVEPQISGELSLLNFEKALQASESHYQVIVSVTACSNVTGIENPVHELAQLAHKYGALIMVDYACSAPYVDMDMNRDTAKLDYFDALFFSPHKFLGGQGTSGVLVMKENLFTSSVPDHPGGGTVKWTNPWGGYALLDNREDKEDGGTPPFIQAIRTAMAIEVKNKMGVSNIRAREKEQLEYLLAELSMIKGLHILAPENRERLGVISFYVENLHYNAMVKMLNDGFGIQVRGGCSCAGTYGHYLLNVSQSQSKEITDQIDQGNYSTKPGWVRLSIHPTQTTAELQYVVAAIKTIAEDYEKYLEHYKLTPASMSFIPLREANASAMEASIAQFFLF